MHIRRKYSQEYKQEAVQLVRQSDIPLAQVATNLGINPGMLRRWRDEISTTGKKAFPGNGTPRDQELARLKRELQQVKQERDFLKEAAVSSTGDRNTSIKFISGGAEPQSFSRALI